MGHGSRAFLAGSLGFAVAFVVACGGQNGLLDSNQASNLNAQLSSVSSAVSSQNCGAADTAAQAFSHEVGALPSTVNTTVVKNLGQGATTLSQLAAQDCSSTSATHTTSSKSSSSSTTTTSPTSSTTTNPTTSSPSSTSSTATNSPPPSSSTTSNGGAGLGGTGLGNGGAGAGGNGQ